MNQKTFSYSCMNQIENFYLLLLLFCIQGLESCVHLEELSIENNCISKFEGKISL